MKGIKLKWKAIDYRAKWRTYSLWVLWDPANKWYACCSTKFGTILYDGGYPTSEAAMTAAELAARAHFEKMRKRRK